MIKIRQPRNRLVVLIILFALILVGIGLWLFQNFYGNKTPVTFDPPYPEVNASGDTIFAVFEGRIPCTLANCEKLKVGLVLYQDPKTKAPTTYWLGRIGSSGNDRIVTQGKWSQHNGITGYPQAVVYELDSNTDIEFRNYWRLNENILLLLDQSLNPKVGNAAWGYMLSRYTEPYGPRTYE